MSTQMTERQQEAVMIKQLQTSREYLIAALMIAIAFLIRINQFPGLTGLIFGVIRSLIYISLFTMWGLSLRERIIQPQAKRYLSVIAALMVLWLLLRTIKFDFVSPIETPKIARYLWYLYYVPILLIPLLMLLVAMSLNRFQGYRLPLWTHLLYIPAALLLALVLSNDLHQLVFDFSHDELHFSDARMSYGPGYYAIVTWILGCGISALVIMIRRCRIPRSRKLLLTPFIPIAVALVYTVLYITGIGWLRRLFGDMTVINCLLFSATLESCIHSGLIQSNTHYRELFSCCTMHVQITDQNFQPLLTSVSAEQLSLETMKKCTQGSIMMDHGVRLLQRDLQDGHVFWTEDVSTLQDVLDDLNDVKESLEDSNHILEEDCKLKLKEAHITEQDRLYSLVQQQTARQIEILARLTDQFKETKDEETKRKLLGKMIVIGAYLKRRSNLIFLAAKKEQLSVRELALTFGESFSNLELYGIATGYSADLEGTASTKQMMAVYDFFEEVIEKSIDVMNAVTVNITRKNEALFVVINTDADVDYAALMSDAEMIRDEDGEWQLIYDAGKADV